MWARITSEDYVLRFPIKPNLIAFNTSHFELFCLKSEVAITQKQLLTSGQVKRKSCPIDNINTFKFSILAYYGPYLIDRILLHTELPSI